MTGPTPPEPNLGETGLIERRRLDKIPRWQTGAVAAIAIALLAGGGWLGFAPHTGHDHDLGALTFEAGRIGMMLATGAYLITLVWFGPKTANRLWSWVPLPKFLQRGRGADEANTSGGS